jgi:hypothetical protein
MTRRLTAVRHRLELVQARTGTRDWQVKRRERTRQLIELGGLVAKAGLVELADDDRAMLYGAFLWMADKLRSDQGAHAATLWQRRGKRAFEADALRGKDMSVMGAP